jgi:rubrerythrin
MFITPVNNEQLKDALEGMKAGVQGEREDELFYDYLISVAPNREDKEIIESIRDDERRHNKYFRTIYRYFTGMEIPTVKEENFERPSSFLDGIKKALFGELRAVEKYREISKNLPNGAFKDVLFEIITDELKHAAKYNYLLTTNTGMNSGMNAGMSGNMNTGMSGGLNTGMSGSMNTGMGSGTNTGMSGNMNTGMSGGSNTGMSGNVNTGMSGGSNTGMSGSMNTGMGGGSNTGMSGSMNTGMGSGTNTGMSGSMNTGMSGGTNTGVGGIKNNVTDSGMVRGWNRGSMEDTSKFTPDDWVRYITPLVNRALTESKEGVNQEHLYQEFILSGVLVGLGKTPQEAIDQVEVWEKTGESQLLAKSKMNRGYYY